MAVKADNQKRHLNVIAEDIDEAWPSPHEWAVPYLDAMRELRSITDNFHEETAESVVRYFLSNAKTWRGETARKIKAELKAMLA